MTREWYLKNRQQVLERNRAYRALNPNTVWARELWRRFGLTIAGYERMVFLQRGVCRACGQPEKARNPRTGHPKRLAVDHDHGKSKDEPGFIRGLLCQRCNTIAGQVGESIEILDLISAYLREATI